MSNELLFQAFLGDGLVRGFSNTLPPPFAGADNNRLCGYRSPLHAAGAAPITPVSTDTWLECVLPRVHDPRPAFSADAMHAIKAVHEPGGLANFVQGGLGYVKANAAVNDLRQSAALGWPSSPRTPKCMGIVFGTLRGDVGPGAPSRTQEQMNVAVMDVATQLRALPWARHAPLVVVLPGKRQLDMRSGYDAVLGARLRQAWSSAALVLNDVFLVDMQTSHLEPGTVTDPVFSGAGLVEMGKAISRLLEGYRRNGKQRAARSIGPGMARFATAGEAQAHEVALVAAGAPEKRTENPALGGVGARFGQGVHVPWEMVKTTRGSHSLRLRDGDYAVPYDIGVLQTGRKPATRGVAILPNTAAPEVIGEEMERMPVGLDHLGGVHFDSDGIRNASPSHQLHWQPSNPAFKRRGPWSPFEPPDLYRDQRVLYVDPARSPTFVASSTPFNGRPALRWTAADSNMSLRNVDSVQRSNAITFCIVLRPFGSVLGAPRVIATTHWNAAAGRPYPGGWGIAFVPGSVFLMASGEDPTPISSSVNIPMNTSTSYVIWARIHRDKPSLQLLRVNGLMSFPPNSPMRGSMPIATKIRVGSLTTNVDSATFETPFISLWRRALSVTEMRFVEAHIASRFGITAPLT